MAEPSGEIVARPMVVRACGHQQEFQHYAVDRYRAQRQAKFQQSRCAECTAKLVEEQQRAAAAVPTKGEALKSHHLGRRCPFLASRTGPGSVRCPSMEPRSRQLELLGLDRSR